MQSCLIYRDHSNLLLEARRLAEEREEGRGHVSAFAFSSITYWHSHARDEPVTRAYAAGSVPPELGTHLPV